MSRKNGIISIENGYARISYNNRIFETRDKSVINMAQRGNIEGAARRYAGKSSTARAIRQANKAAARPIYKNAAEAVFNKMFKEKGKSRLKNTAQSRKEFIKSYKKTLEETQEYLVAAIEDKITMSDVKDRLPNDLRSKVDSVIAEEVQKAYNEKGEVDDSDLEKINDRLTTELDNYIIANSGRLSVDQINAISEYASIPASEIAGLEQY